MALSKEQETLLGKNNYSSIVREISEKIMKAEADTLVGQELLKDVYEKLNESITPLLTLKPFITGAEKIAGDDVKLSELVNFLKKKITGNADLNYLINMCKEEHFAEMTRMNHPSPKATIKEIEEEFDKPGSVIEEGIKSGLFDNLQSDLLNKIKTTLDIPKVTLNENQTLISGNLVKYSPIGIRFEDVENNRMILLAESEILSFDRKSKIFTRLDESITIPENHNKLLRALNSCEYLPETNTFTLNENWDFKLLLESDGTVKINEKNIDSSQVKALLLESVRAYVGNPTLVEGFNKMNYLQDADNFIALMENHQSLIKLDTIEVIKNLNENTFVMYDKNEVFGNNTPRILSSSSKKYNDLSESFHDLSTKAGIIVGQPLEKLFESQIFEEVTKINERNTKIVDLSEEQNTINKMITNVIELKKIAEDNSPAMDKLNEQEAELNVKLGENLISLNEVKNNFKLH